MRLDLAATIRQQILIAIFMLTWCVATKETSSKTFPQWTKDTRNPVHKRLRQPLSFITPEAAGLEDLEAWNDVVREEDHLEDRIEAVNDGVEKGREGKRDFKPNKKRRKKNYQKRDNKKFKNLDVAVCICDDDNGNKRRELWEYANVVQDEWFNHELVNKDMIGSEEELSLALRARGVFDAQGGNVTTPQTQLLYQQKQKGTNDNLTGTKHYYGKGGKGNKNKNSKTRKLKKGKSKMGGKSSKSKKPCKCHPNYMIQRPTNNNQRPICIQPSDPYRTCFQRAEDPNNKLNKSYIDRSGYNFGVKLYRHGYTHGSHNYVDPAYNTPLQPFSKPYTSSDEILYSNTMWLTLLQDHTNVNCAAKIAIEETTLKYLYDKVGSPNTYEPVCVHVTNSAYYQQEALDGSGDTIESTVLALEITFVMKTSFIHQQNRELDMNKQAEEALASAYLTNDEDVNNHEDRELASRRCRPQDRPICSSQFATNSKPGQYCKKKGCGSGHPRPPKPRGNHRWLANNFNNIVKATTPFYPAQTNALLDMQDIDYVAVCSTNRYAKEMEQAFTLTCTRFDDYGCRTKNDDLTPMLTKRNGCASSVMPVRSPTVSPSMSPSQSPSLSPSLSPTMIPSQSPSLSQSPSPTMMPTLAPTLSPTLAPTLSPMFSPTTNPALSPTLSRRNL